MSLLRDTADSLSSPTQSSQLVLIYHHGLTSAYGAPNLECPGAKQGPHYVVSKHTDPQGCGLQEPSTLLAPRAQES